MNDNHYIHLLKKYIIDKFKEAGIQGSDTDLTIYNFDNFMVSYVGQDNQHFTYGKEYFVIGLRLLKGYQQDMFKIITFDNNKNIVAEYSFYFELEEEYDIKHFEVCHSCNCMKYYRLVNQHKCSRCLEKEKQNDKNKV